MAGSKPARRTKLHETVWIADIKPPGIKDLKAQLKHCEDLLARAEEEVRQLRGNSAVTADEVKYLRARSAELQKIEEARGIAVQSGRG